MRKRKSFISCLLIFLLLLSVPVPVANGAEAQQQSLSDSQVFYPIDMSEAVLASRINQKVSGDCAVVSMATVESYLYGVTDDAEKDIIYNTLISTNGDNDYAYWYRCGFAAYSYINWTTVYNNLAAGYPVLVHHPGTSSMRQHWSVVAGYFGSSTTLEIDKFIIVDVNHGNSKQQIFTSKEWRQGTTIDRMVLRNNGIAFTGLSGVRIAINHPAPVHSFGQSHSVYGTIISEQVLTCVRVAITNVETGADVYGKTVTPNAKSYSVNKLDKEITFGKFPVGKYFYTVTAQTDGAYQVHQSYFEISSGWSETEPTRQYTMAVELYGGSGVSLWSLVSYGQSVTLPTDVPSKEGYRFVGWRVSRVTDGKVYATDASWNTEGTTAKLFSAGECFVLNHQWIQDCLQNTGYIFTAVWEEQQTATGPAPVLVGDMNGDGKVNLKDWSLLYDYISGIDILEGDALLRADVDGNGRINLKDWSILYDIITKIR